MSEPRKPLLLGEMPSAAGDRYYMFPLSGNPAQTIVRWLGLAPEEKGEAAYWTLTRYFDTRNAQERHGQWDPGAAERRWDVYRATKIPGGALVTVVCLGRRAERAIGMAENPPGRWGVWHQAGRLRSVTIPHTSGRNRAWNDPAKLELAKLVLQEALDLCAHDGARIDFETGRVVSGPVQ